MSTTLEALIATVVDLLTSPVTMGDSQVYPTSAGARVYAPRDWPSSTGEYPAIFVSAPSGTMESWGRNQPGFTTTEKIRVLARVDGVADANDGTATAVQATLLLMKRQVLLALIGAPALMSQIQQIAGVTSELGFNSGGEKHLGELGIELDLEFSEDWDAFAPLQSSALQEIAFSLPAYAPAQVIVPIPQN